MEERKEVEVYMLRYCQSGYTKFQILRFDKGLKDVSRRERKGVCVDVRTGIEDQCKAEGEIAWI